MKVKVRSLRVIKQYFQHPEFDITFTRFFYKQASANLSSASASDWCLISHQFLGWVMLKWHYFRKSTYTKSIFALISLFTVHSLCKKYSPRAYSTPAPFVFFVGFDRNGFCPAIIAANRRWDRVCEPRDA